MDGLTIAITAIAFSRPGVSVALLIVEPREARGPRRDRGGAEANGAFT
jgi:hypothetical protein